MRVCSKCGTLNRDGAVSCGICGRSLTNTPLQPVMNLSRETRTTHRSFVSRLAHFARSKSGLAISWSLLQAGSFWIPLFILLSIPETGDPLLGQILLLELVWMLLVIAFLFGYMLRGVDRWLKTLVISQPIVWSLQILIILTASAKWQASVSSTPSLESVLTVQSLAYGFIVIIGLDIFWFLAGFIASGAGSYLRGIIAARRP